MSLSLGLHMTQSKRRKSDGHMPALDVKCEQKESEEKVEATTSAKQEERTPEPDSEDSITAERVAEELAQTRRHPKT